MNEIKITTELCAEDRARLDKLLEALCSLPNAIELAGTPLPVTVEPVEHKDFVEIPEPAEENEAEDTDQAPVAEVAKPQHTKDELSQMVASLVSEGKKEKVKAIIRVYAAKVSQIPDDKVDEVFNQLSQLWR